MTDFLHQQHVDSILTVRMNFHNRHVAPETLTLRWPDIQPHTTQIVITGRGPQWLYAGLTLVARRAGRLATVALPEYDFRPLIVAMPTRDTTTLCGSFVDASEIEPPGNTSCPELVASGNASQVQIRFARLQTDLTPVQLRNLPDRLRQALRGESLHRLSWFGQAPVWFAAALSAAADGEDLTLGFYSPLVPGVVTPRLNEIEKRIHFEIARQPTERSKSATVLGVIGDPNSGKSVLTWKLYEALQRLGTMVFRLDCDIAAPTARWGVTTGAGKHARQQQKVEWDNQQDVKALAKEIHNLQQSAADVILLDLPGGLHTPEIVARIPTGREALFQAVNHYILVQRSADIAKAWHKDLSRVNPRSSIKYEVLSRLDPSDQERPAVAERSWHPAKLVREALRTRDPEINRLAEYINSQRNR